MTTTDKALYELNVTEASKAIAAGELSVLEYNQAILARVEELEPMVKAFSVLDSEGWIAAATEMDAEAKAGKLRGPLHGIPIGIKDQFLVKGMMNRIGVTWGVDDVPTEDAGLVARLRQAGAIIAGVTYMPDRNGDPPSCNPWNLEHTPGGSSSGSSAAVGARMLPIAIGESTGGSGIRPPAFCGVESIKPTFGRITGNGMYVISWTLDQPTIIGRSFEDIALVYNAIAGPDVTDPTSCLEPFEPVSVEMIGLKAPRIGFVRNHFMEKADPEMQEAMEAAALKLKEAGAEVKDVYLPDDFNLTWPSWAMVARSEMTTFHAKHAAALEADGVEVTPDIHTLIPANYYLQAMRIRRWLVENTLPLFGQTDFLYTPAAVGPAPLGHGGGDNVFNSPWANLGLPTITFNIGLAPNGLPLGAQLTATTLAEDALLKAGAWCEGVMGTLPTPKVGAGVAS